MATPMMQQFNQVKAQYPDKVVLFRMGDFFESFGEDAKIVSRALNITLTTRNKNSENAELMAGFPHKALDGYLKKLVDAGQSVVIADQLEDPKQAKGIVKRGVTRVVTKGTLDSEMAASDQDPYLMSLVVKSGKMAVGLIDLSTGKLGYKVTDLSQQSFNEIMNSYQPVEVVIRKNIEIDFGDLPVQFMNGQLELVDFYSVTSHDSLDLNQPLAIETLELLLAFVTDTQKLEPTHILRPTELTDTSRMKLDRATLKNLEIFELFKHLDQTLTSMGRRKLFFEIHNPFTSARPIIQRQARVDALVKYENLDELRDKLSVISDIARLAGKIGLQRVNPKDYLFIKDSIESVIEISELLKELNEFREEFDPGLLKNSQEFATLISKVVAETATAKIEDGRYIAKGYDQEIDRLRGLSDNSKQHLEEFVQELKEQTGIPSLKVGFNKVFGYYIEVSNAHKDKVPQSFIRKQTLVNAERYINPRLKEIEDELLNASAKLEKLEYELFIKFREETVPYITTLQKLSEVVAIVDLLAGFAMLVIEREYILPEILDETKHSPYLNIEDGVHPIVAQANSQFISNNLNLGSDKDSKAFKIITGPNMAGKSTYIRQNAILVLMAQLGAPVAAKEMSLTPVDRIFTRVGASDDLSGGRSTFMVEMDETANILLKASNRSFVILDEVGRGTSTYDGVSIAWAISEYLIENLGSLTLFATHYHELIELVTIHEDRTEALKVGVEEDGDDVIFLHKISKGSVDRSYGVHVAKMAGVPQIVVSRAQEILDDLRGSQSSTSTTSKSKSEIQFMMLDSIGKDNQGTTSSPTIDEVTKAELEELDNLRSRIESIDINDMTPLKALIELEEIKGLISDKDE